MARMTRLRRAQFNPHVLTPMKASDKPAIIMARMLGSFWSRLTIWLTITGNAAAIAAINATRIETQTKRLDCGLK